MNSMTKLVLVFAAFFAFSGAPANAQSVTVLESTIIGSTPGQIIGGVTAGGAPWEVKTMARTVLKNDGLLGIELTGLVLVNTGTNPVAEIAASLVCGGSGGAVAATSHTFALSPEGNAAFSDQLTLPTTCLAPVVIVRAVGPNGPSAFIAATGVNPAAGYSSEP
jgi:hypothetical protein